MNKTVLVIMAAGIGSRYGGGIKQLEQVGPSGEIIMDYSIYDAIEAGFDKIVFIIRRDLEKDFKEIIGNRIEKKIKVEYVFQELDALPQGFQKPERRTKPWGTGQAILCCKGIVTEPFAVINADDYYGKEAFQKVHQFLSNIDFNSNKHHFCMAGFILGNTLSENGTVTRGVCKVDSSNLLTSVEETYEIRRKGDMIIGKGESQEEYAIPLDSVVSMNMWGFTPAFLDVLETGFCEFLKGDSKNLLKSEYLLPKIVGELLKHNCAVVSVLQTNDKWFGVTYREDKQAVAKAIQKLVTEGKYPESIL